ncbi:MAG TPA: ATP-binding protein [Planctomycetota bacterium]|nr:ATP-binding protein [Planctomycetota bacterium]
MIPPSVAVAAIDSVADDVDDEHSYARALLNILDDAAIEQVVLGDTQRALLNILDDCDAEKRKAEAINAELRDEVVARTAIQEDLREAKTAAEAASKELEAFSYSVAHDLRAPLRSIDGFSKALLEDYADKLDEEGREFLRMSRDSAQQMALLIEALLKLAHVSQSDVRRERVDLTAMARAKAEILRESQPARVVEFSIAEGMWVDGDSHLLDVVLANLLGNAWKFTGKRADARIGLGCDRAGGRAVFFVRDNGAGFDMAYAQKLFGVFQRLHRTSEFPGTGIGLATVQRIVRRHGGDIWATGEPDRGATFHFTVDGKGSR